MKSFRPHQGLTIMNYETVVYRAARMLFPSPTGGYYEYEFEKSFSDETRTGSRP